jgi:peptide/nickel transport system substrate-binding protein
MLKPKTKAAARLGTALAAAAMVAPLISVVAGGSAGAQASYPRSETLYTSGTAYVPPNNFNPNDLGSLYTGTYGLLYEPLYLYDPIHGKYIPWLAASSGWKGSDYIIHLRPGVDWVASPSGTVEGTMTGNDVAFSIELAKNNAADPWNSFASGVKSVSVSGLTVTVHFGSPPPYTDWQDFLWQAPILPASVWSKMSSTNQMTSANTSPVGTGPMLLNSTTSTQACFSLNPHWWGSAALGLHFKFKYLCDEENSSNNVELSDLLATQIDWSNNFLPGIAALVNGALGGNSGYGIKTYYPTKPYMLSANTVWLDMNTTKAPMSNVNFRKAVAYAINTQQIQSSVYAGSVKVANPTGLLPNLDQYVSKSVVSKYGFSYNPSLAKKYLKMSGYSGQKLTIEVPDGWTDWMAGIDVISQDLNAIGIHVTPEYPQYATRESDLINGTYDMALDNNAGLDSTPWSYFDRVFNLPILSKQSATLNWARYTDKTAWGLVEAAGTVPLSDTAKLDSVYGQLEQRFLQGLPDVPLWYNGAWFQGQTKYWTNYPSSTNPHDQYTPVMWRGWLGSLTTIFALANLKPA